VAAPSRTAAIGATRVARIAGARPARTVTTMPTASEATTVRGASTRSACGSSSPSAPNNALSPRARPAPRASPVSDASTPIASVSTSTERSTWRREAPSVRSVASSRVRCAIVMDRVLKMTKAPTNRAMPPNESRAQRR
jgi:hypothetical protein